MEDKNKDNPNLQENTKEANRPARSYFVMVLAGFYLIYTGFCLCRDVLEGKEGGSWGFFAAGAVFIVIGAGMLFISLRGTMKKEKEKKEAEKAEALENPREEPAQKEEQKRMSISQRANLVKPEQEEDSL